MAKIKILRNPKKSSKNVSLKKNKSKKAEVFTAYDPVEEILKGDLIAKAILECLRKNDPKGVMEMISIYVDTLNKVQAAKNNDLSQPTSYYGLKQRNPTVKTLAKLVSLSAGEIQPEMRKR